MIKLTYGSVCSGIESASIAWEPIGFEPLWFSEIEPFPSAVLAHHWPRVPNLGDMTKLAAHIRVGAVPAPLILVGGTPCQAFSFAGKRQSLDDDRGQLTLKYVELLNAIDEQRPGDECVAVWENVPGVLTTKDNAFGCFLGELAGAECELQPAGKKWTNAGCVFGPKRTVAWRTIDAQHFGVAQRRRRVFVVASARKGFDPTQVLFESEGVRWDSAPSREAQTQAAGGTGGRFAIPINSMTVQGRPSDDINPRMGSGIGKPSDPQNTLSCNHHHQVFTGFTPSSFANYREGCGTLKANGGDLGGGSETLVEGHRMVAFGEYATDETASTMKARDYKDATDLVTTCFDSRQDPQVYGNLAGPCSASVPPNAVAHQSTVRRLTPIECERLQGFDDNHTRIPWRKKPAEDCPDGPRYKAIGNSKAVPCIRWIGLRIIKELYRCY